MDEELIERNQHDLNGDNHVMTSVDNPLREDAFVKTDEEKMVNIEKLLVVSWKS